MTQEWADVGFFFPANIQQLKLQQGKGAFLGGGGESSWEKEHLRIMLIIKKKKVLWHWSESI